ncbi:galactosyl transferase GMA12/MNN10 family-domain-containing protein [Polychytrium aggregatum]|uniref:galactosyl transferase GMA12/MNN10 family-domain-containing protein n=1 Tax=Polychytrium aggregatum TaxID=110093 RepID=UPI0022FDC34B|nr:galactosyl transferase GMA12/MNN10 family-domain-containing protein [Polychytrium aggregatum]KAI9197061.1 galactosyl transferase GMA12/MNN10 family-domain-containing protein [Polychytrium aggregatum]
MVVVTLLALRYEGIRLAQLATSRVANSCTGDSPSPWQPPARSFADGSGSSPPRIALLVSYSGDIRNYALQKHPRMYVESVQMKREYARKHGYALFLDGVIDKSRPHWGRVGTAYTIMNTMPSIEWILYMDVDTMIMEPELSLEDLILAPYMRGANGSEPVTIRSTPPRPYQDIDFIGKQDCEGRPLNNGVYFMRNSEWTIQVLGKIFNDRTDYNATVHRPGVQDAMTNVLTGLPWAEQRHFFVSPPDASFNRFATDSCPWDEFRSRHFFRDGEFLLHFAGSASRDTAWGTFARKVYERYPDLLHRVVAGLRTEWTGDAEWLVGLEMMLDASV